MPAWHGWSPSSPRLAAPHRDTFNPGSLNPAYIPSRKCGLMLQITKVDPRLRKADRFDSILQVRLKQSVRGVGWFVGPIRVAARGIHAVGWIDSAIIDLLGSEIMNPERFLSGYTVQAGTSRSSRRTPGLSKRRSDGTQLTAKFTVPPAFTSIMPGIMW